MRESGVICVELADWVSSAAVSVGAAMGVVVVVVVVVVLVARRVEVVWKGRVRGGKSG